MAQAIEEDFINRQGEVIGALRRAVLESSVTSAVALAASSCAAIVTVGEAALGYEPTVVLVRPPPMRRSAVRTALLTLLLGMLSGDLLCDASVSTGPPGGVHEIRVEWYSPNGRWDIPLVCFEVMRQDPSILCTEFSPLKVQGGMGYQSGKIMAFATGAGPDVFNMWTYEIASYVEQGFLLPLTEFVGADGVLADGTAKQRPDGSPDRNGRIDDDEATWEYWKQLDPIVRKIATHDGVVYTIPARRSDYVGLVYRKDLLRESGIPETPPADWQEFWRRMQILTRPEIKIPGARKHFGRHGLYLHRYHIYLYPWVWASGGNFVLEGKTNPRTGDVHWWPKEELAFADPETGESLAAQPSRWKVTLNTPEVLAAYDFLWKLLHGPWIRDPETQLPLDVTAEDIAVGAVQRPGGGVVRFVPGDIIRGVARTYSSEDNAGKQELFERGEVACFQSSVGTEDATSKLEMRPDQMGFWAVPPRSSELSPNLYISSHWLGLSPSLAGDKGQIRRGKAWKIASSLGSDLGKRMYIQYMVQQGMAMFMTPEKLKLAGLEEYIEEIPEHWRREYARLFQFRRFEPFNANWLQVARNDLAAVFDELAQDPEFDYRLALNAVERRANTYIMSSRPEADMRRYRRTAWLVLGGAILVVSVFVTLFVRALREKAAASIREVGGVGTTHSVHRRWLPWVLLAPALLSITLWAYYPLIRGTAMAFMDYRLMGERTWVGIDNFINVFLDHQFQQSVLATLRYVVVALSMTFLVPIVLAILLNEIPWFKQSYRTLFFLPQVCSGVVIMLLWKQMYEGSARGYLNQILLRAAGLIGVDMQPIDWLGSTFWAPICVVLPGLWAGAGMGSLIYLAALKSVPDDLYEAADLDGAGLWQKIRSITIPTLYPLIVINFVGAFIGTFHQMQNIFVMTGGGSGTRVLSLHIWLTAYADLKFGPATATAWVLGSMLIGFTVWQLQILKKVEFRRALEN